MGETDRLTLREAAEVIGLPLDALRKRVYRGTIPAEKIDGQYFVLVEDAQRLAPASSPQGETSGETVLGHGSDTGETPAANGLAREYIDSLTGHISFLREQNESLHRQMATERERFDIIHREALQRIEALTSGAEEGPEPRTMPLEASQDDAGATQAASMTPDTSHPQSHVASWLSRFFGRS